MTRHRNSQALRLSLCLALFLTPALFSLPALIAGSGEAQAQANTTSEKDAFEAAKALGTVEAWDAFLSNYPTGFHADLARAYVKKLAEQPSAPPPPAAQAPAYDYPMVAGSWGGIVRSGPGQNYANQDSLKEGEQVTLMAPPIPVTPNDYPWFKIAYGDGKIGYMWGGILCSTGAERPDLFKLCTFTPVRGNARSSPAQRETYSDHGPTPEQSCKDAGMTYNGSECVPRKKKKQQAARDNCPGDSVWKNGRCVKEAEPEFRPPIKCTGGQLYSLSQERCVCQDGLRWNGQRCYLP